MPGRQLHPPERVAEYTARGWWSRDTMDALLRAQVARQPDRLAVVDPANKAALVGSPPRRLTWAEVDRETNRLAGVLLDQGAAEGDVLGVQLPNTVELVIAYLAAWRIGLIVTPFPVQFREH
jgi:acyl-CoA synthetase